MTQLDWSKLPASLRYLQEPAEKYGAIEFDGAILEFLDKASQDEMNELRSLANRIRLNDDVDTINRWIDAYPFPSTRKVRACTSSCCSLTLRGLTSEANGAWGAARIR